MATKSPQTSDSINEVETLFQLGAHLGHRKARVHPKAYRFIYKFINGVSIIDLTKTVNLLNKARTSLTEHAKEGKKLLLVATKKSHAAMAAELAQRYGVAYTTTKWLPGLITNFETLFRNVQKLERMKKEQESGTWDQFVKHERVAMSKALYRLERFYKGLLPLKHRPDVLLVIDAKKEKNAITEARKHNIPVIAIVDTNSNPDEVTVPVVMNDDSPEVVRYVLENLLKTYSSAYTEKKAESAVDAATVAEEKASQAEKESSEKPVKPKTKTARKPASKKESSQ
ncbi:MAG: 30S ribosomal protein S2 [Patescibacteria group bacterium]|nr:30S ribosomal protein S2 [Patescibacteria group bacterium]